MKTVKCGSFCAIRGGQSLAVIFSLAFAVLASPSVFAQVDYAWQGTEGGDLADGANWNQSGAAPGSSSDNERILIQKNQSAPLTLSKDISLTSANNKHSTFSFSGEMKFDTAETSLTLNQSYWQGNNKTFSFTRGILDLGAHYFENGSNNSVANNTWTIDGTEGTTLKGSLNIGVVSPNNLVVVTNGATAELSGLGLGRNCGNYGTKSDLVASNNIFRVTGAGSKLIVSSGMGMGTRENNRIEILDGATAVVGKNIRIGEWQYDAASPELPHVFDRGGTVLVSGRGSKLTVNPTDGFQNSNNRVTIGWSTSSNTLEVANGAEFVCYSNLVNIANYLKTSEGNATYNPVVITNRVPGYRFRGNRLRITGEGSKMTFVGTASTGIAVAKDNACAEDNRIEVLDGGTLESIGGDFSVNVGLNNGVYVGPNATFIHDGYNIYIGNGAESTNCYFTVEGGTCTISCGFVFGNQGWGAQFNALAGAQATIGDDTGDTVNLGGKTDDGTRRNASFNVTGADTAVTMGGTLNVNNDSILSFDVPREGFAKTPLTVNTITFGTKSSTPPTLRVTQAQRNRVRYVTLVESANTITVPDTLTLDLPAGARLLKSGDAKYDPKKIIVRLKTDEGLAIIVR